MKITFVKGDATNPVADGNKIILHVCNDFSKWGKGFVLAISKRWKEPEEIYRSVKLENLNLGDVQFVPVEKDIVVANMIGQHDIKPNELGEPPIRYWAIRECLKKVNLFAIEHNATIHCPRFGSGLAGGNWFEIEKLIHENIIVDVTVYDLK